MQQASPPPRFATARLATGPQVHYTELGDPGGEAILFLPAYADRPPDHHDAPGAPSRGFCDAMPERPRS